LAAREGVGALCGEVPHFSQWDPLSVPVIGTDLGPKGDL